MDASYSADYLLSDTGFWLDTDYSSTSSVRTMSMNFGIDYAFSPDTVIGLFGSYDESQEEGVRGVGWLSGPYFASSLSGYDMSGVLLYGASSNRFGTDSFSTRRSYGSFELSRTYNISSWRLRPTFSYFSYHELLLGSNLYKYDSLSFGPRLSRDWDSLSLDMGISTTSGRSTIFDSSFVYRLSPSSSLGISTYHDTDSSLSLDFDIRF